MPWIEASLCSFQLGENGEAIFFRCEKIAGKSYLSKINFNLTKETLN